MGSARRVVVAVGVSLAVLSPGGAATVQTPALRLELQSGLPARLENRLSGEVLSLTPEPASLALLWRSGPVSPAALTATAVAPSDQGVAVQFAGAEDTTCRTLFRTDPATGEVVITQAGQSGRAGLYGVQWGLAGLDAGAVTVIVPGMSGVAFHGRMPASSLTFSWPMGWEAGMVLVQMPQGGFLVWAKDPELRYKTLVLDYRAGRYTLRLQSENQAPFTSSRAATSVEWRIRAYQGDWRAGAALYRDWMSTATGAVPLEGQQPGWVRDIRFVAIVGLDMAVIEALARQVDARQTLLYVPAWRRDPYDRNYPDYTADERFPAFVEAAHRLGFRVMPHVNYFGCDLRHPLYERFKAFQLRSPHSGELEWWTWPLDLRPGQEPAIKFAYIHPGLKAWRDLMVERYRGIVEAYHVDALHLDQTLCMSNHAGGLVEGLSVPQGNRRLHQDLRAALPQVALSGEGLDEVTMPHEAFAQRHAAYAVDHVRDTWSDAFIACGHPISSFLFLPCTTIYGYLGMSNPAEQGPYNAWRRAYGNWGVIPTFSRPAAAQVESHEGLAGLLIEEAAFWTRHRVRPDFGGEWTDRTRFRFRGGNGTGAVIERLEGGGSRLLLREPEGERELYRYITGVRRYAAAGQIAGWFGYDDTALIGLDPGTTYLYAERPREPRAPHVSGLPSDATLVQVRQLGQGLAFALGDMAAARFFDLAAHLDEARTGVRVDGTDAPLERGAGFSPTAATLGGVTCSTGIFAHPPWHQGVEGMPLGETFGEYEVGLPAGRPAELTFALGLREGVNGRSDGVTYRVEVEGKTVFEEHWAQSVWADRRVDLAAFAGRKVRLRLVTTPGPRDDPTFDWAVWGDPLVRLLPDATPQPVTVSVPQAPTVVVVAGKVVRELPAPRSTAAGLSCGLRMSVPAGAAVLWSAPVAVSYPVDLAATPFSVSVSVGGQSVPLPIQYVGCSPGKGVSAGVGRAGLTAHPPNGGRTYADYLLQLPPARQVRLCFGVALQDGSTSTACRFLVEANGLPVFDRLVTGPDGWHDARVDLSAYAGGPLLLSLIVDSEGPFSCDWARWAEPIITAE